MVNPDLWAITPCIFLTCFSLIFQILRNKTTSFFFVRRGACLRLLLQCWQQHPFERNLTSGLFHFQLLIFNTTHRVDIKQGPRQQPGAPGFRCSIIIENQIFFSRSSDTRKDVPFPDVWFSAVELLKFYFGNLTITTTTWSISAVVVLLLPLLVCSVHTIQ